MRAVLHTDSRWSGSHPIISRLHSPAQLAPRSQEKKKNTPSAQFGAGEGGSKPDHALRVDASRPLGRPR